MPKTAKSGRQRDYMNRNSLPIHTGAAGIEAWELVNTDWEAFRDTLRHISRTPEELLLLAVLEDAIYLVRFPKKNRYGNQRNSVDDAREWFESENDDWPFDFLNICDHFHFSPTRIRLGLDTALAKKGRTPQHHHIEH